MVEEEKPMKLSAGMLEQWNDVSKFIDMLCRELVGMELRKEMLLKKLQAKMDGQQDMVSKIQQLFGLGQQQQFQVDTVTGVVTPSNSNVVVQGRVPKDGE